MSLSAWSPPATDDPIPDAVAQEAECHRVRRVHAVTIRRPDCPSDLERISVISRAARSRDHGNSARIAGMTSFANISMFFIAISCGMLPTWKMPCRMPQPAALMPSRSFWRTVSGLPTMA